MIGEIKEEQQQTATLPPKLTLADLRALTPTDLRDLSELRREHVALKAEYAQLARDQAQLQEEAKFLREQLAVALSGWRDAQQRPSLASISEASVSEIALQDIQEEETEVALPSSAWARFWQWLAD